MKPPLDDWLPKFALRVAHQRTASVDSDTIWQAARSVRLSDTRVLGRLVRWRIPGVPANVPFDELFRSPPFMVLADDDSMLISGLVGRIWTLQRDYPQLRDPEAFRDWSAPGTVRVLIANWVEPAGNSESALCSEARVAPTDRRGRVGLAAVRPLVAASHHLVGSEGIAAAVELAERRYRRAG
jgi:hypothetical protein